MARIKAGQQTRARRKNILAAAKGFQGRRKNTIRTATAAVWRAGQYAYRDRKVLSDIAIREPAAFAAVVEKAKAALAA